VPSLRTQALVIGSVDVMESSRVITLFTRDLGKVAALAKGIKRVKSAFQAALDLLGVYDMVVLHKASEALDLVTEAALLERFDSLRRDLAALFSGYYIAELLAGLTDLHDPHPKLFDAAVITLRHLGDPVLRVRRLHRFELACLRELGLMPALEACVHCGKAVEDRVERVAFGLAAGGVLCPGCVAGQGQVVTLEISALEALRVLAAPGPAWRTWPLAPSQASAIRSALGALFSHHLGRPPRLLSYLGG
jgi:DNA repair protein RecO (recombination protein O)